jgi:16S rRNA (guanine966-N2)-methyltransferase
MRIIGGSARGRRLKAPRGLETRPTADRVRQTLFDVLGQRCDDQRVLDLFAGTGALGLEALSRGARACVFVESGRAAGRVLAENVATLGFEQRARLCHHDALSLARVVPFGPFDLVLADPPYATGAQPVLDALAKEAGRLLGKGARIVIEHPRRDDPKDVPPLVCVDTRRFGETLLSFYRHDEEGP